MLPKSASLRHVALAVNKLDECEEFYNMLGMKTELKTGDYVYLSGQGACHFKCVNSHNQVF